MKGRREREREETEGRGRRKKRERVRERGDWREKLPFSDSHPRWAQQARLSHNEAKVREFHLVSPVNGGTLTLKPSPAFPGATPGAGSEAERPRRELALQYVMPAWRVAA